MEEHPNQSKLLLIQVYEQSGHGVNFYSTVSGPTLVRSTKNKLGKYNLIQIDSLFDCGVGDEGRVGDLFPERVEHLLPVGLEVAVDLVDRLETNSIEKNWLGVWLEQEGNGPLDLRAMGLIK